MMSFLGISLAVLLAVFSPPPSAVGAAPLQYAVWSEFTDYKVVEGQLPWLKSRGIELYLAVHESETVPEEFFNVWRKAQDLGVVIRPWLLLSETHGYWANKWNFLEIRAWTFEFLRQMTAHHLATDWIIFDIEPPRWLMESLTEKARASDFRGILKVLSETSRNGAIKEVVDQYKTFISALHMQGVRIHAVTNPLVLHDFGGNDRRVQSALGLPVQNVDWDEVSIMAYRPEWQRIVGPLSSDIVFRYAQKARAFFGERAGIDLGEVGYVPFPFPFWGYTNPEDLKNDIQAVLAANISKVHVYSLDGMKAMPQSQKALWFPNTAPLRPAVDIKSWIFEASMDRLMRLLPAGR